MRIDNCQLLAILRIGQDTSMRGEGMSLRDAIARSGYEKLREEISPSELVPLLRTNPELIKQWVMYCEDKRTSGGYWVSEDSFEVGTLESPEAAVGYGSLEEAVAEFIVRELDFWSEVGREPGT